MIQRHPQTVRHDRVSAPGSHDLGHKAATVAHARAFDDDAGDDRPGRGTGLLLGGADDAESVKPLLFSVSETCKMLGLSQSSIYVLISKGELETVRFASVDSVRITRESITRLLEAGKDRAPRTCG